MPLPWNELWLGRACWFLIGGMRETFVDQGIAVHIDVRAVYQFDGSGTG